MPALSLMARKLHDAAKERPLETATKPGLDMLLWNDIAHGDELPSTSYTIVTGYPDGPTNLPLGAQINTHTGIQCDETCRHRFLNRTKERGYWFCHKCPRSWIEQYRQWFPCAMQVEKHE